MSRAKVYPRVEGRLLLTEGRTMLLLDLAGMSEEDARSMYNRTVQLLEVMRESFYVQSGVKLVLDPTTDGWRMSVEDSSFNQRNFRWLKLKAQRMERLIVQRVNEEYHGATRYKVPTKAGRPRGRTAGRQKDQGKVPGGVRVERQSELQPEARGSDTSGPGVQGDEPADGGA